VFRLRGEVDGRTVVAVLDPGENLVGASAECRVVLPSPGVSRVHAAIAVDGARITLSDRGSKNGTLVNRRRVDEAAVRPGDLLGFGPAALYLEKVEAGDVELAVALAAADLPAPPETPPSTATHTGAAAGGAPWLAALAALARAETAESPDAALAAFVDACGAHSGALLRLVAGEEPHALAVTGPPGAAEAAAAAAAAARAALAPASGGDAAGVIDATGQAGAWAARRLPGDGILCLLATGPAMREHAAPGVLAIALALLAPRASAPQESSPGEGRAQRRLCFPPGYVVCGSAAMRALYRDLEALTAGTLPVVITGETGAGKELVARALHLSSPRAAGPFVAVNCAAIPAELLEAELFGVVRGAATGVGPRRGRLQLADGGTLLLDEIAEMPAALQAKLLRALQDGEMLPVGADRPVRVDLWLLSATNSDIGERTRRGAFRQDLYYRLAGAAVHVPALRQRPDDIPALAAAFLREAAAELGKPIRGLSVNAVAALQSAPWPGNVRQLRHEVRALALRCPAGAAIDSTLLPDALRAPAAAAPDAAPASLNLPARQAALERELIDTALRLAHGNRSEAARLLGISRLGLYKKLRRFSS
jgi:DNA-binding NtrC family response regulator